MLPPLYSCAVAQDIINVILSQSLPLCHVIKRHFLIMMSVLGIVT